ncbi:hypothetical protein OIU74_017790 [Salix koriyanagi]|uniref:Uncharacterized protein n=1 Tax=Salix koriyanagi TaxID=2511006 RepID=A0A9Q0WQW6_9ROSI|nr:hypothetical protein OIU74_017790 [Salix koriyanagi]
MGWQASRCGCYGGGGDGIGCHRSKMMVAAGGYTYLPFSSLPPAVAFNGYLQMIGVHLVAAGSPLLQWWEELFTGKGSDGRKLVGRLRVGAGRSTRGD